MFCVLFSISAHGVIVSMNVFYGNINCESAIKTPYFILKLSYEFKFYICIFFCWFFTFATCTGKFVSYLILHKYMLMYNEILYKINKSGIIITICMIGLNYIKNYGNVQKVQIQNSRQKYKYYFVDLSFYFFPENFTS